MAGGFVVLALAASLLLSSVATAAASVIFEQQHQKGVGSTTGWLMPARCDEVDQLHITWGYDWQPFPNCTDFQSEFVPMIWGSEFVRYAVNVSRSAPALLSFNEPDLASQSDMTVAEAVALWPRLEATGLRLGSPAPTHSDTGVRWLTQFLGQCVRCRVDFIALHYYGDCNATNLIAYVNYWAKYSGRPVWLTEFDCMGGTAADNLAFAEAVLPRLQQECPAHERYAWFATRTAPTDALSGGASLFEDGSDALTPLGQMYASFPA